MKSTIPSPWLALSLIVFGVLALTTTASASLINQTVSLCTDVTSGVLSASTSDCEAGGNNFGGSAVVVDPGVEFVGTVGRSIDLTGDTVTIAYAAGGNGGPSSDLFVLTDLFWSGTPGVITGLTLLSTNLLIVQTIFTDNAIGLQVTAPECCTEATSVTFRIETRHLVPEPATLALLGLGLLGVARRRALLD